MQRPVPVGNVLTLDGGNIRSLSASDPHTLAERVNALFASYALSPVYFPYVIGWSIGGGGGGAKWRCTVELATATCWGVNTSIPASVARMRCAAALHDAQITKVAEQMLLAIQAEDPDAHIWGQQIAGSGRDGTYIVAILYSVGGMGGLPTYNVEALPVVGPFAVPTVVASWTMPGSLGATYATNRTYLINYYMEIEDTSGAAGVVADFNRLLPPADVLAEQQWAAPAGEWLQFGGHIYRAQENVDQQFDLRVTPVGANVSVRRARITAELIHNEYSPG